MWQKSDCRFFDYDDHYAKNVVTVCSICGKLAVTDKCGNGECYNCGWKFGNDKEELAKKQGISYPMSVPPSPSFMFCG